MLFNQQKRTGSQKIRRKLAASSPEMPQVTESGMDIILGLLSRLDVDVKD